jgi:hypothetical protein
VRPLLIPHLHNWRKTEAAVKAKMMRGVSNSAIF